MGEINTTPLLFLLGLAFRGLACSVWVFLRKDLGCDALSWQGLAAVPVLVLYAGFGHCPEALTVYLPLYLLAVIFHRIHSRPLRWHLHALDEGEPWVANTLCFFLRPSEHVAKGIIEPLIAFAVGGLIALAGFDAMGLYVIAGGGCLAVKQALDWALLEARSRAWLNRERESQAFEAHLRRRRRWPGG